jgi:O-antigen ligase
MDYLILLYFILFVILSWRRIDLALLFIFATLPSYLIRFSFLGIPMTLLELMILSAFGVWFLKNYKDIFKRIKIRIRELKFKKDFQDKIDKKAKNIKRYPFDVEIILVLIISFIAVATAGFSNASLGIWKAYFFEPLLLYILIINLSFKKKGFLKNIFFALCLSALSVSLLAIYQKITGDFIFNQFWADPESRRVVSLFGYPNAVGLYLGPIIFLLFGYLLSFFESNIKNKEKFFSKIKADKIKFFFFSLTLIVSFLAIIFAKSKGAILGILIGFFIFALFYNKYLRNLAVGLLFIIGLGLFFINPFTSDKDKSAYISIYEKVIYSKSFQIRKQGWLESWEMIKDDRFLSGAGLAEFKDKVKPYHQEGFFYNDGSDPEFHRHTVFNEEYRKKAWQPLEIYLYPHNIILNFWSELGFFGMIIFLWIIGKFFYYGFSVLNKNKSDFLKDNFLESRAIKLGIICAMVAILGHGLVDVPYFKNDLAILFWTLIALSGIFKIVLSPRN